jgi:hypothetical protein
MIALGIVALVAVVAIVAVLVQADRHANQVSRLLAHHAGREAAMARERWELLTRVQAPQAALAIPAPEPVDPHEVLKSLGLVEPEALIDEDEDDVDESHLVGTVAS